MKNYLLYLPALLAILLAGGVFSQAIVAESQNFKITAEYVYIVGKGKNPESTKLTGYQVSSKDPSKGAGEKIRIEGYNKLVEQLYQVVIDGKKGVLDLNTGKMILPAIYKQDISMINQSLMLVRDKSEWIYRTDGTKLIAIPFQSMRYYANGSIIYDQKVKDLVIYDLSGKKIATFPETEVTQFHDDELVVRQKGKYGIVNIRGEQVLPFVYEDAFFETQYLSLAKKDASGAVKYGMFTSSDLATDIFPFEFDYIKDISITRDFNDFSNGFIVFYARTNTLVIMDDQRRMLAEFRHFPDLESGWETAKNFGSLEIMSDYYAVANTDGYYSIYLADGRMPYPQQFDYCSYLEPGFEDYLVFYGDEKSLIVPKKYKSMREYSLPFEILNIEEISENAYLINTAYGDNIFLPYRQDPLLHRFTQAAGLDYVFYENFRIACISDYNTCSAMYDILNDSVIAVTGPGMSQAAANRRFTDYLGEKIMPLLEPLTEEPVNEIYMEPADGDMFRYVDQDGNAVFNDMPYNLSFSAIEGQDGARTGLFAGKIDPESIDNAMHFILDAKLRVIRPLTSGALSEVHLFPSDTIFISTFFGMPDSLQVYSLHHRRTIYNKQFVALTGQKYFYPHVTPYGIMNYEGKTGLLGYDGKLIIPFRYSYFDNDAEYIENSVMAFPGNKETCYFFTKAGKAVTVKFRNDEIGLLQPSSDAYVIPIGPKKYQLYDKRTAKPALSNIFSSAEFADDEMRYLFVSEGKSYGLIDLRSLGIVEDTKHSLETIYMIYQDKYAGR